jgi:type IV pilus assembly protein PilA
LIFFLWGFHLPRAILAGMRNRRFIPGFTLIEVLIVLGIIAILAAVVLVAINPGRQFAQARNTQRLSNVTTILNAIDQRVIDGRGTFAGSLNGPLDGSGDPAQACPEVPVGGALRIASAGGIDLSCLTPTYIPGPLPVDPGGAGYWHGASEYDTGYEVSRDERGRYTVSAPGAELGEDISAIR